MSSKNKNISSIEVSRSGCDAKQMDSGQLGLVVEEKRICVDEENPRLPSAISIDDISAKNFLLNENQSFDKIRFEHNLLLSYQPSLEKALNDWPDWRNKKSFRCIHCERSKILPVKVTRVERLVVYREIPAYKEVVGWKVSGAECNGAKCFLVDHTERNQISIYFWNYEREGKKTVCKKCAERMREAQKQAELSNYLVF